ncbi:hypothetical protein KIPB_006202, partial [Kipferlia bialata]|eukprot:g6202.t1
MGDDCIRKPSCVRRQFRCTPIGCCCGLRWLCNCFCCLFLLLASLVMFVVVLKVNKKKAAAAEYEALPEGLSIVDYHHSLALEATEELPLPVVGSNVLLQLRYKGEAPEEYIGVFK